MPKPPIFPLPNTTYFPVSFRHYAPRVSPTGGAVFTPPQAAPSAAMFSLPNDGFPSLLSRYFSALQSGAPVTAGHRRSAGRLSPFRQFLLSPPLFSVIPSFFCRIYVFILHSLYKENAGTNQPLCPCALPVMDIRRKDDELPSLDIVFFQLILQAGAWDPQPGRCFHDLPVAGLHGR